MADDPDSGVRRELILAIRNLPTARVGDALRKLAASWDGQDRWYLEALGLAMEKRESGFLSQLFDAKLTVERVGVAVEICVCFDQSANVVCTACFALSD